MTVRVSRRVDGGGRGFADGLLVSLVEALRSAADGEIVELTSTRDDVDAGLRDWSRLTGYAIVEHDCAEGVASWRIRKGAARFEEELSRPIGSRLWLYTNFDCNLRCDYCCVRSSPDAPRRALGLETALTFARQAKALRTVEQIFVTGGEPFLLPDIGPILEACADAAPTTVLTNGMLFGGPRATAVLDDLPKDRVTLQISIDSATPELHDLHRGAGTFQRAWRGVVLARERGLRVRLAATLASPRDEAELHAFFDRERIAPEDRVVRRVALRGFATDGVALSSADLVPEPTFTASGVYWHPVGADDADFLVTKELFPLGVAIDAVRKRWDDERALFGTLASIFHCA